MGFWTKHPGPADFHRWLSGRPISAANPNANILQRQALLGSSAAAPYRADEIPQNTNTI